MICVRLVGRCGRAGCGRGARASVEASRPVAASGLAAATSSGYNSVVVVRVARDGRSPKVPGTTPHIMVSARIGTSDTCTES